MAAALPYDESASYFTVREVTVSYELPSRVVRRVGFGGVSSARLAFTGYNLWSTFSYKGPGAQAGEFGNPVNPYPAAPEATTSASPSAYLKPYGPAARALLPLARSCAGVRENTSDFVCRLVCLRRSGVPSASLCQVQ